MATSDGKAGVIEAPSMNLRDLEAWIDDPESTDSYSLRQWRHWRQETNAATEALQGGDDAAMGKLKWVIKGDLLQALLAHCPDESVRTQVLLDGYPIPHVPLGCRPDDFAELMNDLGVTYRDLAYTDLHVAVLQQLRGDILRRMQTMVTQMFASLAAQVLRENAERHHLPYDWPFPEAEFTCLSGDDAFTAAVRAIQWETTDLSVPYRPWFEAERWQEMREKALCIDRTYVRRVSASELHETPIMPITNGANIEAILRYGRGDESE